MSIKTHNIAVFVLLISSTLCAAEPSRAVRLPQESQEIYRHVAARLEAEPEEFPSVSSHEEVWNRYLAEKLSATTPTLFDGSRPDLVFGGYAVEVDWAERKWREGIGQAFLYSELTGHKPGVLLLVKDRDGERVELLRAFIACKAAGVRLWLFDCNRGQFIGEVP